MADRILFDPSESDIKDMQQTASVISLADVRLSRGWAKPSKVCGHKNLVYSDRDRRIECKDCDQPVEAFDAFMTLCRHFTDMERASRSREVKTREALASVIIRRAAKALDKAWGRKMAPCCPHCQGGLLPEDFETGGGQIGADLERTRRARARANPDRREG